MLNVIIIFNSLSFFRILKMRYTEILLYKLNEKNTITNRMKIKSTSLTYLLDKYKRKDIIKSLQ